jgi:hypothetical protein
LYHWASGGVCGLATGIKHSAINIASSQAVAGGKSQTIVVGCPGYNFFWTQTQRCIANDKGCVSTLVVQGSAMPRLMAEDLRFDQKANLAPDKNNLRNRRPIDARFEQAAHQFQR